MLAFEPFPTAIYSSLRFGLSVGPPAPSIRAALGLACLPARRAQLAMTGPAIPLKPPPLLLTVMLLVWFQFVQLPPGLDTVVLNHLLFTLPFVVMVVCARLAARDFVVDDQRDRHHAHRVEHRVDAHRPLSYAPSRITGD